MALTLEQYFQYLDRQGVSWPAPPEVDKPKAKPHLVRMPEVRAVTWNIYGTLLAIAGGDLLFEIPNDLQMDMALEKTIEEFKMWASMTRRPGQPSEYFRPLYHQTLIQHKMFSQKGEKHPEIRVETVWEALIKRLLQKDYKFDSGYYGSLNEFSRKVALYFQASLQGVACFPGAADALQYVANRKFAQGLVGNGQCFTIPQLFHHMMKQDPKAHPARWVNPEYNALSFEIKARLPSDKLFRHVLAAFAEQGIKPDQVLHIGSRIALDVTPAKRLGMKTALFAGDKASLEATNEHLGKRAMTRPDALLTELDQIAEIVG